MRKIKFRAWDEIRNLMMVDVVVYPDGHVGEKRGDSWWGVPRAIPMQFTGLTDKNGTEIYEGDIVRFTFRVGTVKGSFEWKSNLAGFFLSNGYAYTSDDCETKGEVIGNIYENPDLLA